MNQVQGRSLFVGLLLGLVILFLAPVAGAQEGMQLVIISPGNGEIFYASKLGYIVAIPVTGRVVVADGAPQEVNVQLAVRSALIPPIVMTARPDASGFFVFYLDLNPDNMPLPSVGERYFDYTANCPDCHFSSEAALPLGQLILEITAIHPAGEQLSAERHVVVDRSELAMLPVQITLSGRADLPVDGIPVQAETRLYEWRGRISRELTGSDGRVELPVEALTQRDTHYLVSVPPVMIDNRRYKSVEPIQISIPPGTERFDPVTLTVVVEDGSISGRVESALGLSSGALVLAVAKPGGLVHAEPLQGDNTFLFDGLALGEYLLTVKGEEDEEGWVARPVHLDLVEEATAKASITLEASPGPGLRGRLVDESGYPLPFGWLTGKGNGYTGQISPLDGRFEIPNPGDEREPVQFMAPGYWSKPVVLEAGEEQEVVLRPRPDLQVKRWGDGQIYLPPESVTRDTDDALSLVRGWIWGHNGQPDPLGIYLEGALLKIQAANFALEFAPGNVSWLYVNEGQATFTTREGLSRQISAGEMMAFGDGVPVPYPVAADELAVELLRVGREPTSILLYETEPTLVQRLGNSIARFGRSLSQVVVAGTYILMILAIAGALLFGSRRLWRARR